MVYAHEITTYAVKKRLLYQYCKTKTKKARANALAKTILYKLNAFRVVLPAVEESKNVDNFFFLIYPIN